MKIEYDSRKRRVALEERGLDLEDAPAVFKSNLQKIDSHEVVRPEYDDIPELPEQFFTEGKLYRNCRPVQRGAQGKRKKKQLAVSINREIVEFFKAQGEGWQAELNAVLQRYIDSKQTM